MVKCTNLSTARSGQESGCTDISNIRSAFFDFQQTGYTLQINRTINTQDRGSFMLVGTILCFEEVHFYVEPL